MCWTPPATIATMIGQFHAAVLGEAELPRYGAPFQQPVSPTLMAHLPWVAAQQISTQWLRHTTRPGPAGSA